MRRKLSGSGFQVVFDINGREAVEAEPLLDSLAGRGGSLEQYIYCSSAGRWWCFRPSLYTYLSLCACTYRINLLWIASYVSHCILQAIYLNPKTKTSPGVYLKSDMMPHREEDAVDPKSRHKVC